MAKRAVNSTRAYVHDNVVAQGKATEQDRRTLEHVRNCINELDLDGEVLEQVAQVLVKFGCMSK